MNGDGYPGIAISAINRHNLSGYKEIVACKSCSYANPKYLHP